jgi:predicted transcriptional regulator
LDVNRCSATPTEVWSLNAMGTAKTEVLAILDQLPDDASLEDIQYRIYVRQKIERGLRDADEGRTVSHEEAKRRLQKWLQK